MKCINSWIIEFRLLTRNFWTWIILSLALASIEIQFYSRLKSLDPGGALTSTAFIVQGGLFFAMIAGYSLIRSEYSTCSDEVFYSLPRGFVNKIMGKVLLLITNIFIISILSLMLLFVSFCFFNVPNDFYFKSILYLILYWCIPFFIAGIIGMIVGSLVHSRMAYPLIILIWLFISPLNMSIITGISVITHIDLARVANFLNLGQTDPHKAFDPVYGLPLEIGRWIQKGLWVTCTTFILVFLLFWKNNKNLKFLAYLLPFFMVFVLPLVLLSTEQEQIIKTKMEIDSVQKDDLEYYTKNSNLNFQSRNSFSIEQYEIDLTSVRNLEVTVKIKIKPTIPNKQILFTLYHNLVVDSIYMDDVKLTFDQKGDQVQVSLPKPLKPNVNTTLTFHYKGNSSPYFFSNEQAVMLPSYFPWLPVADSFQAMKAEKGELVRYPLYPTNPTEYSLHYSGPEPLFTNLSKNGRNNWIGTVPNGITLVAGIMKETKIKETSVVYPASLYRMIQDVPSFLNNIENVSERINVDFNDKTPGLSKVFFLSVPNESQRTPANIWMLNDHLIVGINQMYNEQDLLNNKTFIVPSILNAYIRNNKMVDQDEEIKSLFILGYTYWYQIGSDNGTPLLDSTLDFYQSNNMKDKASVAYELKTIINSNINNQEFLRSFFRKWYKMLNENQRMSWDDFPELFSQGRT